jgi:hypothetical protein
MSDLKDFVNDLRAKPDGRRGVLDKHPNVAKDFRAYLDLVSQDKAPLNLRYYAERCEDRFGLTVSEAPFKRYAKRHFPILWAKANGSTQEEA